MKRVSQRQSCRADENSDSAGNGANAKDESHIRNFAYLKKLYLHFTHSFPSPPPPSPPHLPIPFSHTHHLPHPPHHHHPPYISHTCLTHLNAGCGTFATKGSLAVNHLCGGDRCPYTPPPPPQPHPSCLTLSLTNRQSAGDRGLKEERAR